MSEGISDYGAWRYSQGLPPLAKREVKAVRSFSLSNSAYDGLKNLAESLGYLRGSEVNVSGLLEAIGSDLFDVIPKKPDEKP